MRQTPPSGCRLTAQFEEPRPAETLPEHRDHEVGTRGACGAFDLQQCWPYSLDLLARIELHPWQGSSCIKDAEELLMFPESLLEC